MGKGSRGGQALQRTVGKGATEVEESMTQQAGSWRKVRDVRDRWAAGFWISLWNGMKSQQKFLNTFENSPCLQKLKLFVQHNRKSREAFLR